MKNVNSKNILNLLMGIRFSLLIRLVFKYGVGLKPLHILRFLLLIPTSLIVEIFILVEWILWSRKIRETEITRPPVFIIGHWRSGTTFLHQLIMCDRQFTAPTVLQTIIPEHFLFSTKYWHPLLTRALPPKRPMDEVDMRPDDPQEDEWALIRLGAETPLLKPFFPGKEKKFLENAEEFIPEGKALEKWKGALDKFLRKITLQSGKQIVLKNPFHTPRMKLLSEIFPGARFIHIVRHPHKIVPSSIHTWNIVSAQNAFKGGWRSPSVEETSIVVRNFWQSVEENKKFIREGFFAEVRYEDLEKDPVNELKKIYGKFGIEFSEEFKSAIGTYLEEKRGYRKNKFDLDEEQKRSIYNILSDYCERYGY